MGKKGIKYWLNHFESYISCLSFIAITILLTIQVFSRYVLGYSFTWTEEFATILFVLMIYCAIAAAVTDRKHIRIDALSEAMPFKIKKAMKVISEVVFLFFCVYIQPALLWMISDLGGSVTPLLRIPKKLIYGMIPVLLILAAIRLTQNILRLWKEDEETLGASKPTIDLAACEKEAIERGYLER